MEARKRGRFATEKSSCALVHMHDEWGIQSTTKLIRMKDISMKDIQKICDLANFTLTQKHKTERKLMFCESCLNKLSPDKESCSFQAVYEDYVHPKVVEDNSSSEENSGSRDRQSNLTESTQNVNFESQQCQTDNVIIDMTAQEIDLSMLSATQRQKLAHSLAATERKNLEREIGEMTQKYKSISFLKNFDLEQYLENQNPIIKAFITGLHGPYGVAPSSYKIARAIEELLDTCTTGTVQPIHFMESLVFYCATQSKTGMQILSSQTAYPSYYTVKRWLRMLQNECQPQHPLTSSIYAIDNNQILQKKWGIKVANKCYSSVTTMVVAFDMGEVSEVDVLSDKNHSPSSWRKFDRITNDVMQMLQHIDSNEETKEIHYKMHLVPYLSERIAKVLKEQQHVNNKWIDYVDEKVSSDRRKENFKICNCCGHENPKNTRKCKDCGMNLTQNVPPPPTEPATVKVDSERRVTVTQDEQGLKVTGEKVEQVRKEYVHIPIKTDQPCPKVFVLKPSMHNPNSYDAIRSILLDVGKQAGIKKYCPDNENEVAVIFCDGVPYNLIWRVCDSTYRCQECNILLKSKTDSEKHEHRLITVEFDWVVVLPGPGHIEMNMLKSLVLLLWPVFWKEMVILFNFTSEAALRSARAVSDHHKGWMTLNICRNAVVDELLVPFIRKELNKLLTTNGDSGDATISVQDYFKYLDGGSVVNPNYLFMVDVAFELIDAIFMYRAGVRSGHSDMALAARAKFCKVWTGRHHPTYRELNTNDFLQRMLMPEELREFTDKSMSLNLTGIPFTAEGPDFRLEEVNRNVQSFLPLSPKDEDWERICANYDTLHSLRIQLLEMKGINKSADIFKTKPIKPAPLEEQAVRTMFRKTDYLTNPEEDSEHKSISGQPMSKNLVNFCRLAGANHAQFVEDAIVHNKNILHDKAAAVKTKIRQIHITQEEVDESAKLEKHTIEDITLLIEALLPSIEEVDAREGWNQLWATVVKGRSPKCDYIMFYKELVLFIKEREHGLEDATCESDDKT